MQYLHLLGQIQVLAFDLTDFNSNFSIWRMKQDWKNRKKIKKIL